jgi:hypothetical protein
VRRSRLLKGASGSSIPWMTALPGPNETGFA